MNSDLVRPAAVLWDMDGTLVDTEEYWIAAEINLVNQAGGVWTHADGLSVVGKPIPVTAIELQKRGGVTLEVSEIVQSLLDFVETEMRTKGIPWRPGALELLEKIHTAGIPSALVTMSYKQLANVVLDLLPNRPISVAVTGEIVKHGKPHPEPYLMAAKLLGVEPSKCLAIEDSLTGIMSAEAAGTNVLGIPHMVEIPAAEKRNRAPSLTAIDWPEISQIMSNKTLDLIRG
ncbi:MAG: hypothetical protein RL038_898 [Actinomycetota bacterium]|jgi:HAD superfamily hydrolase (TIGR01509 family)